MSTTGDAGVKETQERKDETIVDKKNHKTSEFYKTESLPRRFEEPGTIYLNFSTVQEYF
jgi:hypothetical protein